jgi:hypothetical protein
VRDHWDVDHTTSPELRIAIGGLSPDESLAYACDWLLAAGRAID